MEKQAIYFFRTFKTTDFFSPFICFGFSPKSSCSCMSVRVQHIYTYIYTNDRQTTVFVCRQIYEKRKKIKKQEKEFYILFTRNINVNVCVSALCCMKLRTIVAWVSSQGTYVYFVLLFCMFFYVLFCESFMLYILSFPTNFQVCSCVYVCGCA